MTQEALKLALEALEEAWYHVGTFQPTEKAIDLYDEARAAIKEALAQTQEPMQFKIVVIDNHHPNGIPYEHWVKTPQRTWVGLTDEEVKQLCLAVGTEPIEVRLIEAKLKEKNT